MNNAFADERMDYKANPHAGSTCPHGRPRRHRAMQAILLSLALATEATARVTHDAAARTVDISDGTGRLELRLGYDHRCVIDRVLVAGRDVVAPNHGTWTGLKAGGEWLTTARLPASPSVSVTAEGAVIRDILCPGARSEGLGFRETWTFTTEAGRILWRIDREYLGKGEVEDVALAGWDFATLRTWTGGLLGHGGVAWAKLFDRTNATYGVHAGPVTLWNRDQPACLRITPTPRTPAGMSMATRFSREPDGTFRLTHEPSEERLKPKHGQHRFLRDRQDVWSPWQVGPGVISVELAIEAPDYNKVQDRGRLVGVDGGAVREILGTIARIGAVDDDVMGSNGYYSGYAVLHEPWIAQLGLAIDDPAYFAAFSRTLDHQRDHAIGADGRVKSRWSYDAGDSMPGSYDAHGYYECQWGLLMDSQPSYAINVAEQFDFTGDLPWLRSHKASVEAALDFLLRRDADGDGLVEMATNSRIERKGSDWIDVIWAAHENAFVNAQLYQALVLWADREEILADHPRAENYQRRAKHLKDAFNRTTADGGFWDEAGRRYVHWREPDGSIHGDNFVVPVNFMAIAYGLCDRPDRTRSILDQVESRMRQEDLFFWPLCLDSYRPDEGAALQFPFPSYENGDLFLAWGETGTRAYAASDPGIAVKYIRKVLERYERDGLAFQRYLRKDQRGAGDDILANNCSPLVGLYRNIYGVRPQWNRLLLDPHITPELDGTRLRYWLRGQQYEIALGTNACQITVDGASVRSTQPFAISVDETAARCFHGSSPTPSLTLTRPTAAPLQVGLETWPAEPLATRRWTISNPRAGDLPLRQTVSGLAPSTDYRLLRTGTGETRIRSDANGDLSMQLDLPPWAKSTCELLPPPAR